MTALPDPIKLAKLLEMAGHPATSDGEALNSLRAARSLLARAGKSLADLSLGFRAPTAAQILSESNAREQIERLHAELTCLTVQNEQLKAENGKLQREAAMVANLRTEIALLREAEEARANDPVDGGARPERPGPMADALIAVFGLLDNWRSINDLAEKLGPEVGSVGVKRLVRLLDEKGLLRVVDSLPPRYRLRPESELSDAAKAFRSRIEDARLAAERAAVE